MYFTNAGEDKEMFEEVMWKKWSGKRLSLHVSFFVVKTFYLGSFHEVGEAIIENVLSNKILIAYLI